MKCLIENGATVDVKTNRGSTPLYIACHNGHIESVKCLIENGANVNTKDNTDCTPLFAASAG